MPKKTGRQNHLQACVEPLKKANETGKSSIHHRQSKVPPRAPDGYVSTRPPAQTSDQMAHSLRRYYPDQVLRDSLSLLKASTPGAIFISNMHNLPFTSSKGYKLSSERKKPLCDQEVQSTLPPTTNTKRTNNSPFDHIYILTHLIGSSPAMKLKNTLLGKQSAWRK